MKHNTTKLSGQPVLAMLLGLLLVVAGLLATQQMLGQQEETDSQSVVSKTVHQEHPLEEYRSDGYNFSFIYPRNITVDQRCQFTCSGYTLSNGYDEVVAQQNNDIVFYLQLLPEMEEITEQSIREYLGPGVQEIVRILPAEVGGGTGYVALIGSSNDIERIYFVQNTNNQTIKIYQSKLARHNLMTGLRIY